MSLIKIDLARYKSFAHDKRRAARAEEFKPYDDVIMKQIPGDNHTQVEAARQVIRDKYATMQTQIDATQTPEELKAFLNSME